MVLLRGFIVIESLIATHHIANSWPSEPCWPLSGFILELGPVYLHLHICEGHIAACTCSLGGFFQGTRSLHMSIRVSCVWLPQQHLL